MKCDVAKMAELIRRSKKFFDDVLPQLSDICIQDYSNINEMGILFNELEVEEIDVSNT
jgi:L-rhamnose mutarotase